MRPLDAGERAAWRRALDLWGVDLHDPVIHEGADSGSFAWFGFPPEVNVDPAELTRLGGAGHLESVFAHEIGHHVLAPSTRVDSIRIQQQMARVLTLHDTGVRLDIRKAAGLLANLWSDMLINVRVAATQRKRSPEGEPEMIRLHRALAVRTLAEGPSGAERSPMWWVLNRAYEMLWSLPAGSLADPTPPSGWRAEYQKELAAAREEAAVEESRIVGIYPEGPKRDAEKRKHAAAVRALRLAQLELDPRGRLDPAGDARLVTETVRTLAADPVSGAAPWAMVVAPYLLVAALRSEVADPADGGCTERSPAPPTAAELAGALADGRLREPLVHPADTERPLIEVDAAGDTADGLGQSLGVAETLRLHPGADPNAVMAAWYEAEAAPHIRPLRQRGHRQDGADIPGPLETWELGDELSELDWPSSLTASPVVVPGITTRRRPLQYDEPRPQPESVRLDVYLDSSGSMPKPDRGSPAVLACTILALSVLRGGGRVRVTSWSGPGQVAGDATYTRDRVEIMRQIATYFGGGTTFPLDLLALRYPPGRRPVHERRHLVVVSDDGLTSMFGRGQEEYAGVAAAVRQVLDTASLVVIGRWNITDDAARRAGYDLRQVPAWKDVPQACADVAARIAAYEPSGRG